jgi:2-polyprenyl-3-methyl-5-hydroxy-6-metoxy-1,4-benzoquinol methylase
MPRPCDLCGSSNLRRWDTQHGIDVLICDDCGMARAEVPEGYAEEAEELYDANYYKGMEYDRKWRFRQRRAKRWIHYLEEYRQPPGNLLDIGCSMGYYLFAAKTLGWTPFGTDISHHAVAETEKLGFRAFWSVHPSDFPDWLPPLDAVTATHVVEHFQDPVDYLRALRERMAPGGVVYIEVPNFQKILRRGPKVPYVGPPHHAQFYTLNTLKGIVGKAGWTVLPSPRVRRRYASACPHRWLPELLVHCPRESMREHNARSGFLSNLHIFARA